MVIVHYIKITVPADPNVNGSECQATHVLTGLICNVSPDDTRPKETTCQNGRYENETAPSRVSALYSHAADVEAISSILRLARSVYDDAQPASRRHPGQPVMEYGS
jgi:hypothetical protein